MNTLGDKIKNLRIKLGWSLDELAQKSRVSKAYLSQLENGASDNPSADILYRIATNLGTSIADLLGKGIIPEEPNSIPENLRKAAIQFNINENYIKRLASTALRSKNKKGRDNYSIDDWNYLYQTLCRIDEQNK